ncbi:MAG: hypothetical protein U0547_02685 [Dehalococcoidia bacterium]
MADPAELTAEPTPTDDTDPGAGTPAHDVADRGAVATVTEEGASPPAVPVIAAAVPVAPVPPIPPVATAPVPPSPPIVILANTETNLLVRALWFVFVGWWLSWIVATLAWLVNLTVIGIPAGVYIFNRLPQIATLKQPKQRVQWAVAADGTHIARLTEREQRPFWQRALYFILVGWWFSLVWVELAWVLCILIITLPLGFWMFGASGKILTLKR